MAKGTKAPAWRGRYLRALARSGNSSLAALQAGVDRSAVYYQCARDPRFAAQREAARARGRAAAQAGRAAGKAAGKAAAARGKVSVALVLQNRRDGPRYVRAAEGRWSDKVEEAFFAALARTACVRWAAAAAGLSTTALYYRRGKYPEFAARWDSTMALARQQIPDLLAAATIASLDPEIDEAELPKVNIDQAIQIARLKCGPSASPGTGGRSRYVRPEPTVEEVRDEVLRRIAAIRRHREKRNDG